MSLQDIVGKDSIIAILANVELFTISHQRGTHDTIYREIDSAIGFVETSSN